MPLSTTNSPSSLFENIPSQASAGSKFSPDKTKLPDFDSAFTPVPKRSSKIALIFLGKDFVGTDNVTFIPLREKISEPQVCTIADKNARLQQSVLNESADISFFAQSEYPSILLLIKSLLLSTSKLW
jgi:hypothetical protein